MFQTQTSIYELVSEMNQRQEILEERIVVLEERLGSLHEQLEALPMTLTGIIEQALIPQLKHSFGRTLSPPNLHSEVQNVHTLNPYFSSSQSIGQDRHTHLHPDDATSIRNRPGWSTGNSTSGGSSGRQLLAPIASQINGQN